MLKAIGWGIAGLLAVKLLWIKLYDPDLWWHLAAGRALVESGSFLRTDIFSHTLNGSSWINFEWLGDVLLYLLMKAGGLPLLFTAKMVLCAVCLALLVVQLRQRGVSGPITLLLFWLGFLILLSRLYERLELATLILLPIFVELAISEQELWIGEFKARPWILCAFMVLWCNIHGGFVYGLAALWLIWLGAHAAKMPGEFKRRLNLSFVLCLAATFVNPYGPRLWEIFISHYSDKSALAYILEWQESSVALIPYFWVLFLISGGLLVYGIIKKNRETLLWAPLVLFFLVWGARHYRNAALSVSTVLPFIAAALTRIPRWEKKPWPSVLWGAAFGWMALFLPHLMQPWPKGIWKEHLFPVGACEFVKRENISGRMFNTYEHGGYIEWTLGPDRKVFFDGRYIFHGLLEESVRLEVSAVLKNNASPWAEFLDKHGVDHALVKHNFQVTQDNPVMELLYPNRDWALVYWDDAGLVFLKRAQDFEEKIRRLEYKAARPYDIRPERRQEVLNELDRRDRDAGFSVIASQIRQQLTAVQTESSPAF